MAVRPQRNKRNEIVSYLADFMHSGKRYRKYFDNESDASRWEEESRGRLKYGLDVQGVKGGASSGPDDNMNLREMFDLVLEMHWKGLPNWDNAFSHSKMFEKAFGPKTKIKHITTTMINEFVSECRHSGNAPATIRLKLATLSTAFNYCVDHDPPLLAKKPRFPKSKFLKTKNQRLIFFSKDEEMEILSYLEEQGEDYFSDFFSWQVDTGCRPIESRFIKPHHIRKDEHLGYVVDLFHTKNGEQRTVPLTRRALLAYKNNQHREYLWKYWTKERIRSMWDKVRSHMNRSTDKDFVFYLTRHTCASRIIQATGSIPLVQSMLGHKTLEQSMRYAKLAPHNLRQALCALDNALEFPDKKVTNMSEYSDKSSKKNKGEKLA